MRGVCHPVPEGRQGHAGYVPTCLLVSPRSCAVVISCMREEEMSAGVGSLGESSPPSPLVYARPSPSSKFPRKRGKLLRKKGGAMTVRAGAKYHRRRFSGSLLCIPTCT